MVLDGSSESIWTALASLIALKVPVVEGMAGSDEEGGVFCHSSAIVIMATLAQWFSVHSPALTGPWPPR
jgi:acetyl-CoA carboxylase alpha subunit